ncbi:jg27539 [Pararge aegeria aegeria]|uniref:Jg27539 protein n=1 Tax=Pararge aegeria aegeria TaxID=348720 RepID=A0A8S4SNS1_9NEOP|nr:jg27539 [Pararge aegeria aegeria]
MRRSVEEPDDRRNSTSCEAEVVMGGAQTSEKRWTLGSQGVALSWSYFNLVNIYWSGSGQIEETYQINGTCVEYSLNSWETILFILGKQLGKKI